MKCKDISKTFFIEMELGVRQWLRPDSERLGNFNLLKIVGSIFRIGEAPVLSDPKINEMR